MIRGRLLAPLAAALFAAQAAAQTATPSTPDYAGVPLFQIPQLAAAERQAARLAAAGDMPGARAMVENLQRSFPNAAILFAKSAIFAAFAGDEEKAFDDLTKAVSLGLSNFKELTERAPLNRLTQDPRFATLAAAAPRPAAAPTPAPTRVDRGDARVTEANTIWRRKDARLLVSFEMLEAMRRLPIADGKKPPQPIVELQSMVARGRAAGNVGDLYDNRDDGHSTLPRWTSPTQMSHVIYSPEARAAGVHYGLNTQLLFNTITIGNSSTALTGALWRSQPRSALTSPEGPAQLAQLYRANHIYVFPEHTDHDPFTPPEGAKGNAARPGNGDLFPANTPYMLISQGSSGSDRPILEALRAILAAFRPDVKQALKERGLIAPMVQQVFRRGQNGIESDKDYLSARAHPVVFDPKRVDLARVIKLANAVQADEIPPAALIRVTAEERAGAIPGLTGTEEPRDERLFNTPSAIARVWRGSGAARRYTVDASATQDPNGPPLKFHWVVTQGREENVSIRPLDETGARAEITFGWATPAPTALRPDIPSPRIDIAIIADNGAALSAPAFFSMLYPAHEERVYETPADGGAPRLIKVDYTAGSKNRRYVDPLTWPRRNWSDSIQYDDQGRVLGWTRKRKKGETHFSPHGLLIHETDNTGRATRAETVEYRIKRTKKGAPLLTETPTGRMFSYRYNSADDRIGEPVENQ